MTQATLALRATQQTALTPRLQQSVRLLQLSSNDFAQELEQALATNPFLEVPTPEQAPDAAASWNEAPPRDGGEPMVGSIDVGSGERVDVAVLEQQPGTSMLFDEAIASPYDDSSAEPTDTHFGDSGPHRDGPDVDVASWAEALSTLRMHLHAELAGHRLDERSRALAELVIEALDDDGYIRQELSEVVDRFDFEPAVDDDELQGALRLVQQLGPPGIAARSVSECLALQLAAIAIDAERPAPRAEVLSVALAIVRDDLERLARRDFAAIRRGLDCSAEAVTEAVELIRSLDPRPGSAFGGEIAQSVVPDVIVRRARGGWHADINPAVIPRVCLNRVYAALFHESRGGDRAPLGQQLQEARWLLRNAAQRFVTIRRVARIIVAEQAAFLDYGDIAIRPLLLRQVADQLDLHESTISRAIGNKFMATPRGVFAFKHFFSRKLATVSGGSCSAASIRAAMRELIDTEDPDDPMSDVMLAKRLADQGLCVARRTVTKYRGLMRIPPVEMRRCADA